VPEEITTAEQARAVYLRAAKLHESGDFLGAIALYNKLVNLGLTNLILDRAGINIHNVRKHRALAYLKSGQFAEAEQEFKDLQAVFRSVLGGQYTDSQYKYWELLARYKGDKKKAMDELLKL